MHRALWVALVGLLCLPAAAQAVVTPLGAGMEQGAFSEFSQTNAENGTLDVATATAFEGRASAHAVYGGGGTNGFSRGIWDLDTMGTWTAGDNVYYGAAFYLPPGFTAAMQGQTDLMRWDNYPSFSGEGDTGGISINTDRLARLNFGSYHGDTTDLCQGFQLPEGQWFHLEVHQQFGSGVNEVFLNGQPICQSAGPNFSRPIERIRFGIVAIEEGDQQNPLELWFDKATVSPTPIGANGIPTGNPCLTAQPGLPLAPPAGGAVQSPSTVGEDDGSEENEDPYPYEYEPRDRDDDDDGNGDDGSGGGTTTDTPPDADPTGETSSDAASGVLGTRESAAYSQAVPSSLPAQGALPGPAGAAGCQPGATPPAGYDPLLDGLLGDGRGIGLSGGGDDENGRPPDRRREAGDGPTGPIRGVAGAFQKGAMPGLEPVIPVPDYPLGSVARRLQKGPAGGG